MEIEFNPAKDETNRADARRIISLCKANTREMKRYAKA